MIEHWYHLVNGKQFGPFSFKGLHERASFGILHPSDEVLRDGAAEWVDAVSVPGLFAPEAKPEAPKVTLHEAPPPGLNLPPWLVPVACLLVGIGTGMGLMALILGVGTR